MCELFAMSSGMPAVVNYSLHEFARHGGDTYGNNSGWGIAYYQDRDALLIKEPKPAADSAWVKFIASQGLESANVIAHVRLATVGVPTLQNTHPFRRVLGGRAQIFAHNGTLKGLHANPVAENCGTTPVGETDSELAFCLLLERMKPLWTDRGTTPPVEARLEAFAGFASEMITFGSSNFLYSDGDALFVHAHRRIYEENGVFSEPRAPGLSMRDCFACRQGPEWACKGLKIGLQDQRTILFASVPLDDQGWEPLPEGTAIAVRAGREIKRVSTL